MRQQRCNVIGIRMRDTLVQFEVNMRSAERGRHQADQTRQHTTHTRVSDLSAVSARAQSRGRTPVHGGRHDTFDCCP